MDESQHGSHIENVTNMIRLPLKGMPKKRPRAGVYRQPGVVYMPPEYMAWKEQIAAELQIQRLLTGDPIEGNLQLIARFGADFIDMQLLVLDKEVRPRGMNADIDNLTGGLMDAIADAGLIVNDRQIIGIEAVVWEVDQ